MYNPEYLINRNIIINKGFVRIDKSDILVQIHNSFSQCVDKDEKKCFMRHMETN